MGVARLARRVVPKPAKRWVRDRVAKQLGLEPRREDPIDFRGLDLADPLEALDRSGGEPVLVDLPVAACRGLELMGFACRRGAGNPFVETAAGIAEGTVSGYEDSPLRRYYEGFRPATLADVFGAHGAGPAAETSVMETAVPWDNTPGPHMREMRRYIGWCERVKFDFNKMSDTDESWRDWGPVSDAKAAVEFTRIERVTRSLLRDGFLPAEDLHDQIWVRLLVSGRRSVASVFSGHHRTAALAALGYETVPAQVLRQVFRREEVASWPGVASGAFTPEAALAIFDMTFEGRSHPWPGCLLAGDAPHDQAASARSAPIQAGTMQAGPMQTGAMQTGAMQTGPMQVGPMQTGTGRRASARTGSAQRPEHRLAAAPSS